MTQYKDGQIYDKDGYPLDLYDVQRVNLICFKCEKWNWYVDGT